MMRKLSYYIVLLLWSFNALAQSADTAGKDTSRRLMIVDAPSINKYEKPLYVVDGKIKGNIRRIKPGDVLDVSILKPPASINIYGNKGANGVVIITTKSHQRENRIKKRDTVSSKLPDSAVYVIDGEVSDKKLVGIDPKDILSVDIIKQDLASEHFEGEARNGLVVVLTKNGAIKSYQNKLSSFSDDYKKYIEINLGNDSRLIYFIKGDLFGHDDKSIKTLYKLPRNNIVNVSLSKAKDFEGIESITVIIETKQ